MKSQLYHVFRTYWNRPLVLVLATMVVVCLSFGIYIQTVNQSCIFLEPQFQQPAVRKYTDSIVWKSFLRNNNLNEIRSLTLSVSQAGNIPDLGKLSNIESLRISAWNLTPELQEQIQSLENLHSLAFYAYGKNKGLNLPEKFFKKLGPQIKELDLSQVPFAQLKGTEHLVNLELLKIAEQDLTPEAVKAINRLPHLKILVVVSRPWLSSHTVELLLELKDHPTLERIYASWSPYGFREKVDETLRAIQMLPLHYSLYSWDKVAAIQIGVFVMLFLLLILFLQLWSQFLTPGAIIIPGYTQAHRLAALIILGAGVLLNVVSLVMTGIFILPALAITLTMPALVAIIGAASQSRFISFQLVAALPGIAIGGIIGGHATVINSDFLWLGRYYADFTLGYYPGFSGLLLIAELAMLAVVFWRLPEMTRSINERFSVLPGISPWDAEKQQRAIFSRYPNWRYKLLDFSSRKTQYHKGSMWKQIQLWRLGIPFKPLIVLLGMGGIFLLIIAYLALSQSAPDFIGTFFCTMFLFETSLVIALMAAVMWGQRCKKLELETMRPVNRKNMVQQLFMALAFDQSFAIFSGLFFGLFLFFLPDSNLGAEERYTFTFIFVAAIIWIYAISTTIFAFKRAWVIWAVIIATSLMLLAVIIRLEISIVKSTTGATNPYELFVFATTACTITITAAIAMLTFTYRKALQREWG